MRAFDFDYQGQTFQAVFRHGHIYYDRDKLVAYFGGAPAEAPKKVRAEEGQALLPPHQWELFQEWHKTAMNTLFELIRIDNEID